MPTAGGGGGVWRYQLQHPGAVPQLLVRHKRTVPNTPRHVLRVRGREHLSQWLHELCWYVLHGVLGTVWRCGVQVTIYTCCRCRRCGLCCRRLECVGTMLPGLWRRCWVPSSHTRCHHARCQRRYTLSAAGGDTGMRCHGMCCGGTVSGVPVERVGRLQRRLWRRRANPCT